jgi:hypothetical protein
VSSGFALVMGLCGLLIISDPAVRADPLLGLSPLAAPVAGAAVGYFVADLLVMLRGAVAARRAPPAALVAHHLVFAGAGLAYLARGTRAGDYVAARFMMMELTTPLVHLGWYMGKVGARGTVAHVACGALLCAAFFVFRIMSIPAMVDAIRCGADFWAFILA